MEHGRRTIWNGGPRTQRVSVRGCFRTSAVITGILSPDSLSASHVHTCPKISPSAPIKTAELNRQTRVFRNAVTHTKQRMATCSNRQKNQIWKSENLGTISTKASAFRDAFLAFLPGLPRAVFAKVSVCINTFLPGSAQQVEMAVTHSKQSTAAFLPGSRIASGALTKSSNIDNKLSEGRAWLRL
jgi:hypothetical protein